MGFRPSLKSVLTLSFIFVSVVPILSIGFVSLNYFSSKLHEDISRNNFVVAITIAGEVSRFLNETMNLLKQIEEVLEKRKLIHRDLTDDYLESLVDQYSFFSAIWITNRDGLVKNLAPFKPDYVGLNVSGQPFFKTMIDQKKPYWSPTFIAPDTGEVTLTLTKPLNRGMALGYVNLTTLNSIISRAEADDGRTIFITDQKGTVIAHPNKDIVSQRENFNNHLVVRQGLSGWEGTLNYPFTGQDMLGSVAYIPQTGWLVVVLQPTRDAFAPVEKIQKTLWQGAIAMMVIALALALIILKMTLNPLAHLVTRARKISEADYQFNPKPIGYTELDDLAANFKTMSEAVKNREDALRAGEERLRQVLQNMPVMLNVFDTKKRILVWNRECERVTGYPAAEVIGRDDIMKVLYPGDTSLSNLLFDGAQRGQAVYNREIDLTCKDGSIKTISWSNIVGQHPIPGWHSWVVGIDVTDRRIAEKSLRDSEEKYRLLVENAGDAIFIAQDGKIKFPNPKTGELTGYTAEEVAEKPFISMIHPEDRKMVAERHNKRVKGEKVASQYSFRIINRSGSIIWVQLNTALITWEKEPATLNFIRDISEQKRLEAQLQQSQKMEAVGTLAGGIAHDFNNILQVINGYTQILLSGREENASGTHELRAIQTAADKAGHLVQQLLTFSRKSASRRHPIDVNREVGNVKELLIRTLPKMIDIQLRLEENLPQVYADANQFEQVVVNLSTNARDAMPDGGTLIIETLTENLDEEFSSVHVDASIGQWIVLKVSDSGHGMTKEIMEHIFDPFFTTKEIGKGTGLGLASVYGIVKSHGGFINCHSETGIGTTFTIYLPPISKIEETDQPMSAFLNPEGGDETILVVDDEDSIRELVKQVLEQYGYQVLQAHNGERALEIYRDHAGRIDLVILDLGMPGMSGHVCLKRLLDLDPDLKVIIASGYSPNDSAKETKDSGAAGFIGKPYRLTDLLNTIRQILDKM